MRIVVCHNFYQQAGGEDQVFADETRLLESRGHTVHRFTVHNDEIETMGRLGLVTRTIWNRDMRNRILAIADQFKPDIFHFHNTFPLISPAAYSAARESGAAVVQTLHNYRLLCVSAQFFRDGAPCEDCLGKFIPWPGVIHKCYRDSAAASAVAATMMVTHRVIGTWNRHIDAYIALTNFARDKFLRGGLPADRMMIKPNFADPDPGVGNGSGGYGLFVGRLDAGKGLQTLLDAWGKLDSSVPLRVLGDGPMAAEINTADKTRSNIEWLGQRSLEEVYHQMQGARFVVIPSLWYEGLPKTLVESFACGTPVIASRLGAMLEAVDHQRTGLLFEPGNADDLANQIRWLIQRPDVEQTMRAESRKEFDEKYSSAKNYDMLMEIYRAALIRRRGGENHEEPESFMQLTVAGRELPDATASVQAAHARALRNVELPMSDAKSVR